MITKFVLIVWIGYGNTQTISIETFKTRPECEAVAAVLQAEMNRPNGWYHCIEYNFQSENDF
jgi:lipoate-protein ligase B